MATRNIVSGESVTQGESKTKDEVPKCEQKLNGHVPSGERLDKMSMCSEEGPLQTHSSANDEECISKGEIRMVTLPTHEGLVREREFHP